MVNYEINRSTVVVILGGGIGTRLRPLTKARSKPAVPIGGKYRLIDIPISNCVNSNLRRIYVLTQFNSASLNRHIKDTYQFDTFSKGFIDILAAEQTPESQNWFQGTADAVRQSLHHINNLSYDYVLILSGDQLYEMDFSDILNFHVEKKADITIATIPVTEREASDLGVLRINKKGEVNGFIEKPSADKVELWKSETLSKQHSKGKEYLGSMGMYVFNRKILNELLLKYANYDDFGKEIIPSSIYEKYNIYGYEFNGYWSDIGTIESFYKANIDLIDNTFMYDMWKRCYTRPRMLSPSVFADVKVSQSIIAEGSTIAGADISRSVIGIRSVINKGTVIRNSIIMGNDYYSSGHDDIIYDIPLGIGKNCHIENAIIDKNCRINDNVSIIGHKGLKDQHNEYCSIVSGLAIVPVNKVIYKDTFLFE